jgi:hypothetical protein
MENFDKFCQEKMQKDMAFEMAITAINLVRLLGGLLVKNSVITKVELEAILNSPESIKKLNEQTKKEMFEKN